MTGAAEARVMLCDDSAVIRAALARILGQVPRVQVVGRAADGRAAIAELRRLRAEGRAPDVLVLDIEMPVMDGLTALPLLLREDPELRVIVASTLTTRGADIALQALRLGAADTIAKPSAATLGGDAGFARELTERVLGLARLRRGVRPEAAPAAGALRPAAPAVPLLLAVGSSTGGPQALFTFLAGLGGGFPLPVVVTQHMPPAFTAMLAQHISRLGAMPCAEAQDGEALLPGRILLAPGDRHLLPQRGPDRLRVALSDGPPENFCRPAVDPMLRAASAACGGRVLVVMLTGMGRDGLDGTRCVVASGGTAIAQDEATSVVWGMPGAIARDGLCHRVLPLPAIAPLVLHLARGRAP
jgi:two-component system chemotaxis response regulator CheB